MCRRSLPAMLPRASKAAQDPADRFFEALDDGDRQTTVARAAEMLAEACAEIEQAEAGERARVVRQERS